MPRLSRCHGRRALAALTAAVAALVVPSGASAFETNDNPREVRSYWTPERMEAAIPGDALLQDVNAAVPIEGLGLGLAAPEPRRRAQARKVENPKSKPFRTHGKVFFTLGGTPYVCSGTSVRSDNDSLVVTAGHCTYSQTSGYASNFMFAPAYKDGETPFGEWTAKKLKATPQWENNENISYDVAFATMAKLSGKKLADRVGTRGIAFGKGRDQRFDVFGYPAEGEFDGESMYRCDSPAQGTDNEQGNPEPTRIDCDMTGGSSGGGWVINGEKVNSVVSYGYECGVILPLPVPCDNPEEGKLFGPYFGSEIKQVYKSQK